jgi:D-glycero-D-manno-heptose 1,7-bisphosphate phosphatase
LLPGPPPEPRSALFLDRDGVLNEEVNYLHHPRDLIMIPGTGSVIAECNRRGVAVLVVSNQAGIGRGLYDETAFESVNSAISRQLAPFAARIDGWYFCPHPPAARCACRKPEPGLLRKGAAEFGVALTRSVMVGDKISDLEAARAAGVHTVLVRTGHGREEERKLLATGRAALFDACRDSLAQAEDVILSLLRLDGMPPGHRSAVVDVP